MMIIKSIIKVKDHCHCTGKYRRTAHSFCNLRYKTQNKIPLVFHNGSAYDYHSIIKNLAKVLEVNLKAQEKIQRNILLLQYQSKKNLIMVKQLHKNYKDCRKKQLKPINGLIKKFQNIYKFCNSNINKFIFLLRKRVCPHEYMDNWERFKETTLPNKKYFYSKLY